MEGDGRCSQPFHVLGALLILIFLISDIKTCSASTKVEPHIKASAEFIRSSCTVTTYPRVCFQSLSAHASDIHTSPRKLAHVALSVSLSAARSTLAVLSKLSAGNHLKPREAGAMSDCIKTIGDSVDELQQSLEEMGHLNGPQFNSRMDNIKTWVSAAVTDEDTCMDGFAGNAMNGDIKNKVRGHVVNIAQLTSNALALISHLS
ncbi:21 kDa protein-like [Magnolia sinica]|uniref:21 kDa protein-like n=1 Tax=Magnolia sinica TaxID=86752 RepID=UPI00265867FF|nr:21 kDa protein-like [Magnolia sinica]